MVFNRHILATKQKKIFCQIFFAKITQFLCKKMKKKLVLVLELELMVVHQSGLPINIEIHNKI